MAHDALPQSEASPLSDSDFSHLPDLTHVPQDFSASAASSPHLELRSLHSSESMGPPRTASREGSIPLRHPTPDLQSLRGAYVGNVERLEERAERMSLSSDIGEEIRKLKLEQRISESRRSSILDAPNEEEAPENSSLNRQVSYTYGTHASSSIVGTNSIARTGGFSPAAYFVSPRSSVRSRSHSNHNSVKGRPASSGRRLTQVKEPEQEGKPLDSPISTRYANLLPAPLSPTRALRVTNDGVFSLDNVEIPRTQPPEPEAMPEHESEHIGSDDQPRASTDTYRQAHASSLFADFDGVYAVQEPRIQDQAAEDPISNRRRSSQMFGNGRPLSYMQPTPGEDMVYYPAPVPMMLNLPKRLSRLAAAPQRNKRRSEMLSQLPTDARKSAIWLPEVSDNAEDPSQEEFEHQASHGQSKRRTIAADLPPQLRASMFFDYPATEQDVEIKGASAVATLDSILNASAFAPVSAFTDHPIAGNVGADIYARAVIKSRASQNQPETAESQKRKSTISLLTKRNSSSNLLDDTKKRNNSLLSLGHHFGKRKSSAPQFTDGEEPREADAAHVYSEDAPLQYVNDLDPEEGGDEVPGDGLDVGLEPDEQEKGPDDIVGEPTTLLAELQLRKQQQNLRNRTAATAFPNGMQSTLLQLDAVAQVEKQARKHKHTRLAWEDPDVRHPGPENEDDEDVPLGLLYPGRKMQSRRFDEDRPLGLIAQRAMEDNEPLSQRRARLRGEDPSIRDQSLVHPENLHIDTSPNQLGIRDEDETLAQRVQRIKATQIPTKPRPVSGDFASEIMSQFGVPDEAPDSPEPTRTATKTPDLEEETLGQRRKRLQAEAERSRNTSGDSTGAPRPSVNQRRSMADILQAHPAAGAGSRTTSNELKFTPAPKSRNTPWAMNMNRQASLGQVPMATGLGGGVNKGYTAPHPMMQMASRPVKVDARQRDMIDRWRQSVMY